LARRTPLSTKPIPAVYIPVPSPFAELEDFIRESARTYNLDLLMCSPESDVPLPVESVTPGTVTPDARKQSDGYLGHTGFLRPVGKARGGEGMRRALHLYMEKYPQIEAILVGTRRSDPHGGEFFFHLQDESPSNVW
jgi:FAD synthetase